MLFVFVSHFSKHLRAPVTVTVTVTVTAPTTPAPTAPTAPAPTAPAPTAPVPPRRSCALRAGLGALRRQRAGLAWAAQDAGRTAR
jgi:hypothetical protein